MSFLDKNQNQPTPDTPASFYNSDFPQPGPNETRVASAFDPRAPNIWDPSQDQPRPAQPQQPGQDQQQPTRVAADQSAQAGSFTSGTPTPAQPPLPPAEGPWGPFGMRAFRPNERQTYIPAAPNRPPADWGTDEKFPMEPASWEVPGIYLGVGQKLSQWGPGAIAPYAAQMGMFGGAWMRGYMRGQEYLARMQHQRMSIAAQETQQRMGEMLREYGAIHAMFGDYNQSNKNYSNYRQALLNAAHKYQDQHMITAIEQLGPDAATRLLAWYDGNFRDTAAANKAREKDEERKRLDNPDRLNPVDPSGVPAQREETPEEAEPQQPAPTPAPAPPTSGAPAAAPSEDQAEPPDMGLPAGETAAPSQQPTQQAAAAPAAPAAPGEAPSEAGGPDEPGPVQVAAAGDQESLRGLRAQATPEEVAAVQQPQPPAQQAGQPQARPQRPAEPPQLHSPWLDKARAEGWNPNSIQNYAEQMILGQWKPADTKAHPGATPYAEARANEMRNQVNAILRDPNLRGDAVPAAIAEFSPTLAEHVRALKDGEKKPVTGASSVKPPYSLIYALAHHADPTLTDATFATRAKTRLDFTPGGAMGKKVVAATTAFRLGEQLREELKKGIPGFTASQLSQWGRPGQEAAEFLDPESVHRLNYIQSLRRDFIAEVETALAGGGAPRQTERLLQEDAYDPAKQSVQAIMGQLDGAYTALQSRIGELGQAYRDGTGWGPDKMFERFDAEARQGANGLMRHRGAGPPGGGLPPGVTIKRLGD